MSDSTFNKIDRCAMEKGRDLCLYSLNEYPSGHAIQKNEKTETTTTAVALDDDDVKESAKFGSITKKYYTNMYHLSKWSKFVRYIYKNDTLDKFCNRLDDGTYILGVPASSDSIRNLLLTLNVNDDEIANPRTGSVSWVTFENVSDVMDLANYLQLQHVLDQCFAVMNKKFPATITAYRAINSSHQADICQMHHQSAMANGYDSGTRYTIQSWYCRIQAIDTLTAQDAHSTVENLFSLINYLQNRSFDWSERNYQNQHRHFIKKYLIAILHVNNKLVSMQQKRKLFDRYVKISDYAYELFFNIALTFFSDSKDKRIV